MNLPSSSKVRPLLITTFTLAALSTGSDFAFAEGFDLQTPEELEAAEERLKLEFGPGGPTQLHLATAKATASASSQHATQVLNRYAHLDPKREVPSDLLRTAILFYDANTRGFPNNQYLTVVDFTPRSDKYRFFLVNLVTGEVEKYHTTHGIGSDRNDDGLAEQFGNIPNSGMSSLGFVRVSEVYSGKYRRSLRLDGLSDTNSNIRRRAVVFHGWDYVKEEDRIQGLSWGCITLDWIVKDSVLDKIKDGSLMYVGVSQAP